MTELLALPDWKATPVDVQAWAAALTEACGPTTVSRDSPEAYWLDVAMPRVRGYAVVEGIKVAAVNFEVDDADLATITPLLERAAASLGWELFPDDPDDEDTDDDQD